MSDNLTDEAERLVLDWLNGDTTVVQPVAPLMVRLTTTAPTDSAAGTEAAGDLYDSVPAGLGAAATTAGTSKVTNAAQVTVPGVSTSAAVNIWGVEIWDSGATPRRIAYQAFGAAVSVPANQPATFAAGALSLTLE
jgi:pectate lyase